ncbi:MAG: CDP-diacylglycerol--glycerol-3-phosphate 3-phosphatidyltransferase [Pseudomonadota bacterium]
MFWTIPNLLTMARLLLLPFILACFFLEADIGPLATWLVFLLYIAASATDFLDGVIARKFNQISAFGTFLDPIADKIYVGSLLVLLVAFDRLDGLWIIPVLLIFFREFLISGLREYLGPHDVQMPVTKLAKWKTATQMLCLGFLILGPAVPYTLVIGQWMLLAATVLTLITGWGYMKTGIDFMREMA